MLIGTIVLLANLIAFSDSCNFKTKILKSGVSSATKSKSDQARNESTYLLDSKKEEWAKTQCMGISKKSASYVSMVKNATN